MWKCEKCGREFKNNDQDHYCGTAPQTITEYIDTQPEEVRFILTKIRDTIKAEAPNAIEKISWSMPTFWQGENLIHFASFKKHVGIYPGELSNIPFEKELEEYHTSKGAIKFPFDKPIPYDLIAQITAYRVKEVTNSVTKTDAKLYEFDAVIQKIEDKDGAYLIFPYDVRIEFGKGRVKVHASFDGVPYDGSIVNMGLTNSDGTVCYIIGIRKDIRNKINKQPGSTVHVTIQERA